MERSSGAEDRERFLPPPRQAGFQHEPTIIVSDTVTVSATGRQASIEPLSRTHRSGSPHEKSRSTRRLAWWMAGAAGLGLVGITWATVPASNDSAGQEAPAPAPEVPVSPAPGETAALKAARAPDLPPRPPAKPVEADLARRTVLVRAHPASAEILLDATVVGTGTAQIEVAVGRTAALLIRRKGYSSRRISVDGAEPEVTVRLRRTGEKEVEIEAEIEAPAPRPVEDDNPYAAPAPGSPSRTDDNPYAAPEP